MTQLNLARPHTSYRRSFEPHEYERKRFVLVTDLFSLGLVGVGVGLQISIKVIYLLCTASKHNWPPVFVRLCASLCFTCENENLMIFQDCTRLGRTETHQHRPPRVQELVSVEVIVSQGFLLISGEI